MRDIIKTVNDFFIGPFTVTFLLIAGVWLSLKTKFVQVRYFKKSIKDFVLQLFSKKDSDKNGISPLKAVSAALSGTIGTGNIVGVASAIMTGGAGAIFWMWVSAFLGMATKFSEITLSVRYRKKLENGEYIGGPMYYIKKAFNNKIYASIFAFLCILASFGIGNMTQSNTAFLALSSFLPFSQKSIKAIMIVIAILIGIIIFGGIKRISSCTAVLIPIMAAFYIGACLFIIFTNLSQTMDAFILIFKSAFSLKSVCGGGIGYAVSKAIKAGFTRGVFTNEAGLGSAPIVHATAKTPYPAKQGLFGVFEVFLDTIVMCTLTGLVIIMSESFEKEIVDISKITLLSFEHFLGSFASTVIAVSTVMFAIATIISWSYYGESCIRYLSKKSIAVTIYKLIYTFAIYFGAVSAIDLVWGLSDLMNTFMMLPNVISLFILSNEVKSETKQLKDD